MAATKIKDLTIKLREYTDAQGQKKAVWHNIGSLMRGQDGNEFILLDRHFNPAGVPNPDGRNNLIVSMFDANRDNQGGGNGGGQGGGNGQQRDSGYGDQRNPPAGRSNLDDEIPF